MNYNSGEAKLLRIVAVVVLVAAAMWWFTTQVDIGRQIKDQIVTSPGLTAIEVVAFLIFILGMMLLVRGIWKLFVGPAPGLNSLGGIMSGLRNDIIVMAVSLAILLLAQHGVFGTNWTIISP